MSWWWIVTNPKYVEDFENFVIFLKIIIHIVLLLPSA